ncbi:MAG TPA: methyltransferase domain-containing protein [Nevskiaceae bacterium]|nr:methyltransferase domain-containing protein [Nevskiaceae bacterium]
MKRIAKEAVRSIPQVRSILEERQNLRREVDDLRAFINTLTSERDQLYIQKVQLEQIAQNPRALLGKRSIRGNGIEIGAAHMPLPVPDGVQVSYVDIATTPDLRKLWPEVGELDLVEVSIVDEGEKLDKIINASQDFVIANHFLEHCLDPIGAILTHHRVLKPNGTLFMAVPDKRHTFDVDRPTTTYQHLLQEHKHRDERFRHEHTEEYVRLAEKRSKGVEKRVNELIKSDYRPHFHAWTQAEIIELFLNTIRDFKLLFVFDTIMQNHHETIIILRKLDTPIA